MSNTTWNRAVALIELIGNALLLGLALLATAALILAVGSLMGGV